MRFTYGILAAAFLWFGRPVQAASVDSLQVPSEPAQQSAAASKNVFQIVQPDYKLSPFTGMTRQHWMEAARYILDGAFSYIHQLDDPMKFPKQPGKSYPQDESKVPTEKLEGLCRTLFVADPLLKENPDLVIHGIKVADYYRHQIGNLVDPTSSCYIKPRAKNGGPSQNLVEFGALAISMFAIPNVIWDPLPQATKDALASTMLSYGDGPTVPSNWKFFNIFVLSFFKEKGYKVNEPLLETYLKQSLEHYRGEGWYNDNPAFDYYSMWAFQLYGVLWSEYFGNKYYPDYASQFMVNFKPVKENYPYLFDRNGRMIMWGRSISYRYAAASPFPMMGFEHDPATNYGWMRRITSGTLLQFIQHPDFLKDSVPTLGFYGAFEPAVQSYSCRGSVYWGGKIFFALLVPEDNPFWTATENEGAWAGEMANGKVHNLFQKGSDILITDYPSIGASEIRAWCHVPILNAWEKFRGSENYNRLSYNSAFPWQADGENGEVAMNYVFKNADNQWEPLRLYTFKKYNDGIYYRDAVLETNDKIKLKLADLPLDHGILRVDMNVSTDTTTVRLGHYALPQLSGPVTETTRIIKKQEVRIISNGQYQLAMIPLEGWDYMETIKTKGLHPQSENSTIINAVDAFTPGEQPTLYVTLMLWRKAGEVWKDSELMPIKKIIYIPDKQSVLIRMKDGKEKIIWFD